MQILLFALFGNKKVILLAEDTCVCSVLYFAHVSENPWFGFPRFVFRARQDNENKRTKRKEKKRARKKSEKASKKVQILAYVHAPN